MQEGLSPNHLKKAKLMFFYTRYPSSNMLKTYFSDVKVRTFFSINVFNFCAGGSNLNTWNLMEMSVGSFGEYTCVVIDLMHLSFRPKLCQARRVLVY